MSEHQPGSREALRALRWALTVSDAEVGPACMNVPVPPTIAMDDTFREAYAQGYRHALADVRAATVQPPGQDVLRELVAKWRANAVKGGGACECCLDECADELAAALSGASSPSGADSESLRVAHARMQGSADGFQRGWHAALLRVRDGDNISELDNLVPLPAPPLPSGDSK